MVVSKDSLSRRKSIAVTSQSNGVALKAKRRRAHSVVPSELSPLTRSRLSLGPIKGILKSRPSLIPSQPSSTSIQLQSQKTATTDERNATQSMDFTQDIQAPIHDNFARKSMGRRVSFSATCSLRFFNIPDVTGSSVSSQEAPGSPDVPSSDDPPNNPVMNDENAYPGAATNRRRSSMRKSFASTEDMDLTTTSAAGFIFDGKQDQSALADEEFDFDESSDMNVTQAFGGNVRRKSSVAARAPLTQISSNPIRFDTSEDYGDENSQSYISDQSLASDTDHSQPMEITVPLSQSLRPAHQDEAWLALVRATHSGEAGEAPSSDLDIDDDVNVIGGDDMDVSDAIQRVMRARQSIPVVEVSNDSMSMSDGSFENNFDAGNETINFSKMLGRVSAASELGRPSMAYQDSTMDESEIYGSIVPPPHATSTPRPSLAPQPQVEKPVLEPVSSMPSTSQPQPPPVSSVFSRPPGGDQRVTAAGPPAVFIPPSVSPKKQGPSTVKPPPKALPKQFSAAFAPPVSKPTPKKPASVSAPSSPTKSPGKKRERAEPTSDSNGSKPSPAKRLALAAKWSEAAATTEHGSTPTSSLPTPQPLPVNRKALFQAASTAGSTSSIRRPSDYFARRRSMAVGSTSTAETEHVKNNEMTDVVRSSPKKKAGIGLGRASMGSGPSDAWKRFKGESSNQPAQSAKGKETETVSTEIEESPIQEDSPNAVPFTSNQVASALPSPPSASPAAPSASVPTPLTAQAGSSSPVPPVVDLSSMLTPAVYADEESELGGMDMAATERWRDAIPEDGYEPDEGPPISIAQFFEMTDIKFMDELTAPRRSMHPSQEPNRQARNPSDIPLSEYAIAMAIDVPQLVLYSRISRDLEGWMEQSKAVFQQAEEEATKMTPELFTEYSRADQEGQMELRHQLSLIKTNTRALAKSDWYDWKLQWVEGLKHTAQIAFTDLESDAKTLEKIRAKADEIVPELQREYEEVMRELEAEQREVAEIEQCDQDYLNELKASLAEQNIEVEALKAEVKEGNDQLQWLQERLQDIEEQKREANAAISEAGRILHIQTNSTQAEVFRLKDELEALEDLHRFRITKVSPDLFEYVYSSEFRVTVPCRKFLPIVEKVDIIKLPEIRNKYKDDFPRLSDFLLAAAKELIRQAGDISTRQIVQTLADYWSSTTQLRSQIRHISLKYPVEIEVIQTPKRPFSMFKAHAMILFPTKKSKVYVSYVFESDTFSRWPTSIGLLHCEVKVAYGPIDGKAVLQVVNERLSQASPSDHYACLLDACILAQEDCDS